MGLLDNFGEFIKTPEGMGLLSAVAGGLAGAQRGQPINSLGRAGLAGVMGYGNALDRQERTLENDQQRKLRQMQMDEMLNEKSQFEQFTKTLDPSLQALPKPLLLEAWKQKMQPKKPIVLGRTLKDPETYQTIATDETWQGEQEAARAARVEELKQRSLDRIAQIEAAARMRPPAAPPVDKVPMGYRMKPDGSMEAIPGGPADLKAQAASQRQADGATDVDVALSSLRDAYDRLEKGGGITSTQNNPLANLSASASSSAIGQGVGKMLGTQNQSARNDIAMGRPALLAALMKATGMSAKQMDSNAELKLWLTTATDPTLDVESNRRALANIEKKYLKNGSPSDSGKTVVKTGRYNGKKVTQYSDGSIEYAD